MPWPDLGVVCCLSGVPGEVRERSFWLKEVSLSLTCSNIIIIIIIIIGIIIVIIIMETLTSASKWQKLDTGSAPDPSSILSSAGASLRGVLGTLNGLGLTELLFRDLVICCEEFIFLAYEDIWDDTL